MLGVSILGTHKINPCYLYLIGDDAIRTRQRGIVVSETGCRAVYYAFMKDSSSRGYDRQIEVVLNEENCSRSVSANTMNNRNLFLS